MQTTQLLQIRKDFYLNIRRRVEAILGNETKSLKVYRESYEREIGKLPWQAVDKKYLFARIKSADLVMVGDFHAQKQSSRGFLRVVRKIKAPLVLALECLRTVDQPAIDAFLAGELAEKEFLAKVAWKKNWGFPWDNYKALFKWAQQNSVPIYGINTHSSQSLNERDRFSAKAIADIRTKCKGAKVFVQYGDLHLASAHLPKLLRKSMPSANLCVIYQSPEILYFKIMERQQELSTDVVRFNADTWALNGVPPWVKWQDYLLHLESGHDKRVRVSDVDPTDTVAHSVAFLSQSFGLNVSTSALSVYTSDDDSFFNRLDSAPSLLRKRIIENVQEGSSFYIPELECGYLARYSVNHVSRVAAQYIYAQDGAFKKTLSDPKKEFYKTIWMEAVIYFFGKAKNPKKKTDTLQDIRSALQKEQFDDRGKEALMLSLTQKLNEMQFLARGRFRGGADDQITKYSKKSYQIAAQIIGGMIGEKLFYAFNRGLIKFPVNRKIVFMNLADANFKRLYYESLELVESWPIAFKSKYDKL